MRVHPVKSRARFCILYVMIAAAAGALLPAPAAAQTYEVLHGFSQEHGGPGAPLLVGPDGRLYGTTQSGGRFGSGSVFVLTPNGSGFDFSTLWDFSRADGWSPSAGGLTWGSDGYLYGTTHGGGANDRGTIFRLDTSGTLTTIHVFNGSDGSGPTGGLVQAADGRLYGTTTQGGTGGAGTVFRIDTSGSLTTLCHFSLNGSGPAYPAAPLVQGTDGHFYGTSHSGGSSNGSGGNGTIFRIDSSGTLTVLNRFAGDGGNDGKHPRAALVQGSDGRFYGTTSGYFHTNGVNYAGTVFWIDPIGGAGMVVIHKFTGANGPFTGTDGQIPSGLVQGSDGSFYGTTVNGGASGFGTIFRINSTGSSFATLYSFTGMDDGRDPLAALVQASDGSFYGTTFWHGASGSGTVFRINTSGSLMTLHAFGNSAGIRPRGGLVEGSDGLFYGTTADGGAGGAGTVFRINASGELTTLHTLRRPDGDGLNPMTTLVEGRDGNFYGTTRDTIFRVGTGGSWATLHAFGCGEEPRGGLVEGSDGHFYGTTSPAVGCGGLWGTIFKIDPFGSLTTIHRFENPSTGDGVFPTAGLVEASDGYFYGTTTDYDYGSDSWGNGTIFWIDSSGSLTTLHRFAEIEGRFPRAALIQGSDGQFYGTTERGGAADLGTIFRVDTSGSLETLHSFSGSDGAFPWSALVQGSDGSFYGTTPGGGSGGNGTIFRINSAGSLAVIHSFAGPGAGQTVSELVQGSDGSLYGTTSHGGPYNGATVFRLTLPLNTPSGTNVTVDDPSAVNPVQITFDSVSSSGTTSVAPIDPATAGDIPGGFAISDSVAYHIQTTAVFSGPITIAFFVPDPITEEDFNSLVILHNENGVLVDVTASRDYATRTIYAATNSFSPFYLARSGRHISTEFNQTEAYKSGSTAPIKLRLWSALDENISSPSTVLTARHLRRVGDNTSRSVVDSGHANAGNNFRYDKTLGGYIFNLSTKGLTPGTWVLSVSAGRDDSFMYLVRFEVK